MDGAKESWKEVADRVESLGLKLKMHLEQEKDDQIEDRQDGDTQTALEDLSGKVTDAFDAFGNASRDAAVKDDVRTIAELIKMALLKTLRTVGAEVGGLMEQIDEYAENASEKLADSLGNASDTDTDTAIDIDGKTNTPPSDSRNDDSV